MLLLGVGKKLFSKTKDGKYFQIISPRGSSYKNLHICDNTSKNRQKPTAL